MSRQEAERLAGEALEGGKWFNDGPLYSLILRRVADLLEPLLVGREWQGMDSAPKDGTAILLGWFELPGQRAMEVAFWNELRGSWCQVHRLLTKDEAFQPTHWQPLPTPLTKEKRING